MGDLSEVKGQKPKGKCQNRPGVSSRPQAVGCRHESPVGREWNGRVYARKQVRPVFVEEPEAIVVVTVYVYYVP